MRFRREHHETALHHSSLSLRHYVYIVVTASMTRAKLKKLKLKKYYNMLLKRRTRTNNNYLGKY